MRGNVRSGLVLVLTLGLVSNGCGTTAPTPVGNEGEWSGTTNQGMPIAFTVSPDQKVTRITIGYNFNGCSGSQTFSGLSLETVPNVTCIPGPCSDSVTSYRAFAFSQGERTLDGPSTSVNGFFVLGVVAQGAAGFVNYPVCGTALSVGWSATRR